MKLFTKNKRKKAIEIIDEQIEKLLINAKTNDEISEVLVLMAQKETLSKDKKKIDPNTLITAGASILGIVLLISYEHWAPITSKALSFIVKGRV